MDSHFRPVTDIGYARLTTLYYTTPHYTTLHYTTLHYTTPHYTQMVFVDLDGSFTGYKPNSTVLNNGLVADSRAFPECFYDERYDGMVCGPELTFVQAGSIVVVRNGIVCICNIVLCNIVYYSLM